MQKTVKESRPFGDDTMSLEVDVGGIWRKAQSDRKEIWESLRKDGGESALRVEVFFHLGKIEHVTVSERREGRLFKSEFNSLLEPVATASNQQIAEEHVRKIAGFINQGKGEFFNHMMDSGEITTRVQVSEERYAHLLLNKKIVSELQLKEKMSCRWTREGDALVMTPLKETSIPMRIMFSPNSSSFTVVLAEEMSFVQKLKAGDYVKWKEEGENLLSLKKVSLADTTIITKISGDENHGVLHLPEFMGTALQLEEKPCCKWEQEGKTLIVTPLEKTMIQTKVMSRRSLLQVTLPEEVQLACGIKLGDYVELSREGNLLSLKKAEAGGQNTRKTHAIGDSIGIDIPQEMAGELGVKLGMYCVWSPGKGKTFMEFRKENPLISKINRYDNAFRVYIPATIRKSLRKGDEVLLEVTEGRIYLKRREDFPEESGNRLSDITKIWHPSSLQTSIPEALAEKLKVEKVMYGIWTFDEEKLWLGLMRENPNITTITIRRIEYADQCVVSIPVAINPFKKEGEIVLKVKDGKLYITPKKAA